MLVKEIMSKNPDLIDPTTTLKTAALEMQKYDFGFIPVGENDRLVGVLTDRDIAVRAVASGKDPNTTRVRDVMSKDVFYCFEDDDISKAADTMSSKQIHRLLVLNDKKRFTGVISLGDIATHCKNDALSGHIVESISVHH
jgi:CBS domain-containing protein